MTTNEYPELERQVASDRAIGEEASLEALDNKISVAQLSRFLLTLLQRSSVKQLSFSTALNPIAGTKSRSVDGALWISPGASKVWSGIALK